MHLHIHGDLILGAGLGSLTGMGSDGAQGLLAMRRAGAMTLGQARESCVVYGMPRSAQEIGAVHRERTLGALPEAILAACQN